MTYVCCCIVMILHVHLLCNTWANCNQTLQGWFLLFHLQNFFISSRSCKYCGNNEYFLVLIEWKLKKKKSPNYSWTKISLWFCFEKNHGSHGKFLSPKLPNSFIQVSDSGSDGPRVILKEIDGVSYKIQG